MIRYSSSFFLSILLHLFLLLVVYIIYTLYSQKKIKTPVLENRYKVQLCTVKINSPIKDKQLKVTKQIQIQKQIPKPKPKPKPKIIQKPILKTIQKPILKTIENTKKTKHKETPLIEDVKQEVTKKDIEVTNNDKKEKVITPKNITKEAVLVIQKENEEEKLMRLETEYRNLHIEEITQLLSDNLYYPRSARKRGITGTVTIKFKLSLQGEVYSVEVVQSNSPILTRAAITTIKNLSKKFPSPNGEITLHVPIKYTLSK